VGDTRPFTSNLCRWTIETDGRSFARCDGQKAILLGEFEDFEKFSSERAAFSLYK